LALTCVFSAIVVLWIFPKINYFVIFAQLGKTQTSLALPSLSQKLFHDFVSSFGNIQASLILHSFLTKFDRKAGIIKTPCPLRQEV